MSVVKEAVVKKKSPRRNKPLGLEEIRQALEKVTANKAETNKVIALPLNKIDRVENSRVKFNDIRMAELMVSMKQTGLLQPVGVRTQKGSDHYELVFGNRRVVAAQKLGWETIDAIVLKANEDEEMLILNAVENMHHEEVAPIEQGRIFFDLVENHDLTVAQIAARIGVRQKTIRDHIAIYQQMPKAYRKLVTKQKGKRPEGTNRISLTGAFNVLRAASKLGLSPAQKAEVFEFAKTHPVSGTQTRTMVALYRQGVPLKKAIRAMETTRVVNLVVGVDRATSIKLEKETGRNISALMLEHLLEVKKFGVVADALPTNERPPPQEKVGAPKPKHETKGEE